MAGSVNVGMFIAFRFVAGASAFMILAAGKDFDLLIEPVLC